MCKKNGFTLIELLVVISIIAVLMAVMMPSLSKARNMARRTVCGSHMHNMGVAIENYKADSNGDYPLAFWHNNGFIRTIYTESLIKAGIIGGKETVAGNNEWVVSASSTREAYSCPSFRRFLKVKGGIISGNDASSDEKYPIGYGYNAHLSRHTWDNSTNSLVQSPYNLTLGKTPRSNTLMLMDSSSYFLYNIQSGRFYPIYDLSSRFVSDNGYIAGSHTGAISNSLWVDMHVEQRKADEYTERNPNDPSDLVGTSVLDHRLLEFDDRGYAKCQPAGKIACPE